MPHIIFYWGEENEEVVGRGIRHGLEVVRLVLVMTSNVEYHHTLKEYLRGWVATEQRISTGVEQIA